MDGMGGWWMGAGSPVFVIVIVLVVMLFARQFHEPQDRHDEQRRGSTSTSTAPGLKRFAASRTRRDSLSASRRRRKPR